MTAEWESVASQMEPGPEDGSFPQPGYGEFSQDESKSYLTAWKDLRRPTGMDKATWDAILDYTLSERTWIDDMTRKVGDRTCFAPHLLQVDGCTGKVSPSCSREL